MSQKHNPPSSVQPSSEQKVARTLRSSPILDGVRAPDSRHLMSVEPDMYAQTQAMMLGTPPKKMLERATATGYAPTEGSSRGTQTISDAHISSRPTMSNRTYSGAFSPNPGADFEVPRAPFAPDSSTAGPSDGSKHSKS